MNFVKSNRILVLMCVVLFFYLFIQGPILHSDSNGYISASHIRGAGYPFFLNVCRYISDSLHFVVIVQMILGVLSICYLIHTLEKFFKGLPTWVKLSLLFVIAMPYFGCTMIGNTILTEPLAYPIFLFFFANLLEWKLANSKNGFFKSLLCAVLLLLIRKQFAFVFVGFYVLFFIDLFKQNSKFSYLQFFAPFIAFAAGIALEHGYMYSKTGRFTSAPSGLFTIAVPIFIALDNDADLFKDEQTHEFVKRMINMRNEQRLSMYQEKNYANFSWPYPKKFEVVHDEFRFEMMSKALQGMNLNEEARESMLSNVVLTLITKNFKSFLQLFSRNLVNGIGGYYYFFLLCVGFVVCFLRACRAQDSLAILGTLACGFNLLNCATISIFMPIIRRYSIYTEGIAIVFWILCFYIAINSFKSEKV